MELHYEVMSKLLHPDNAVELDVICILGPRVCNIGWNNFDPYVKNGYVHKPKKGWNGLYYHLYLVGQDAPDIGEYGLHQDERYKKTIVKHTVDKPCRKIVLTNDVELTNTPQLSEAFEKLYVEKHGSLDHVLVTKELDGTLKISKIKTWSRGITSDWLNVEL